MVDAPLPCVGQPGISLVPVGLQAGVLISRYIKMTLITPTAGKMHMQRINARAAAEATLSIYRWCEVFPKLSALMPAHRCGALLSIIVSMHRPDRYGHPVKHARS